LLHSSSTTRRCTWMRCRGRSPPSYCRHKRSNIYPHIRSQKYSIRYSSAPWTSSIKSANKWGSKMGITTKSYSPAKNSCRVFTEKISFRLKKIYLNLTKSESSNQNTMKWAKNNHHWRYFKKSCRQWKVQILHSKKGLMI
jgi:hypothetical protein